MELDCDFKYTSRLNSAAVRNDGIGNPKSKGRHACQKPWENHEDDLRENITMHLTRGTHHEATLSNFTHQPGFTICPEAYSSLVRIPFNVPDYTVDCCLIGRCATVSSLTSGRFSWARTHSAGTLPRGRCECPLG